MAPRRMRQAAGIKKAALDFLPGIFCRVQIELQIKGALVHPRSANANMSLMLRNSSGFRLGKTAQPLEPEPQTELGLDDRLRG